MKESSSSRSTPPRWMESVVPRRGCVDITLVLSALIRSSTTSLIRRYLILIPYSKPVTRQMSMCYFLTVGHLLVFLGLLLAVSAQAPTPNTTVLAETTKTSQTTVKPEVTTAPAVEECPSCKEPGFCFLPPKKKKDVKPFCLCPPDYRGPNCDISEFKKITFYFSFNSIQSAGFKMRLSQKNHFTLIK